MSFLKKTFQVLTDKRDIKEPIIYKQFNERQDLLANLEALTNSNGPNININKAKNDLKLQSIGQAGAESVFFELKNTMLPILILHDVNIEHEDYHAQIDFLIITHKFLLVLEVKKLFGNVKVTEKGEFQRIITKNNRVVNKEGMYSPLNQAERQASILEKYLKSKQIINKCPVRSAVTFANPRTIIEISKKAPTEIYSRVIRHDQIRTFLKKELALDSPVLMLDDMVYTIADAIIENSKEKPFNFAAYSLQESLLSNKEISAALENIGRDLDELRMNLKEFRLKRAKELDVKPFFIFTNKTMEAMIENLPRNKQELLLIDGIGPKKYEEFGELILGIINK